MSALYHNEGINDFFSNIPDEILAEILKTLPVKSLLRCLCVRKSWYFLVKSPTFINLHLNYHRKNTTTAIAHTNYLLFRSNTDLNLLCLRYDDEHCKEFLKLELPSVVGESACWQATSCGLICVSCIPGVCGSQDRIYVWNPLIQKRKTLPVLDLSPIFFGNNWTALAFGYVPWINDFQVVRIVSYGSDPSPLFLICVFSLNTNSWKTKTIREDTLVGLSIKSESVSVNGLSCWRAFNKLDTVKTETLLCFDTLNDRLRTIPLPQVGNRDSLHQFGQSVALFVHDKFNCLNMWILKQDSIDDFRWEKKASVCLREYLANAVLLGLRNNGEIILSTFFEANLVFYNPESRVVKGFRKSWKDWTMLGPHDLFYQTPSFIVNPVVGSLVLLDTD
ncbi:F-box domain-containing protein [Heracleum sosnowskyi]|uniref:F-box domain-containing protein n=1 Tax=Heracleum sosnowskyi TaxID=360622 RepID=A0AAD8NDB9_9APIA|nr:F-box domain-containing protein [Heracleum sosnowskyi]